MKYRSIFASQDLEDRLKQYLKHTTHSREQISSVLGIDIHVMKALPSDSALFINHRGNVVGVYCDGKLVEIPQDVAENLSPIYPLLFKKKSLEVKKD